MSKPSQNTRNILYNSGYFLILDLGCEMNSDLLNAVSDAVVNTLVVACTSRGIPRIPFFGLSVVNTQFEIIWKLHRLKGNFTKIMKAFQDLKKVVSFGNLNEEEFLDYLHVGIKQIMDQFNEFVHSPSGSDMTDIKLDLNIVILTKKEGFPIKVFCSSLLNQIKGQNLREIQIVELNEMVRFNSIREGILHLIQIKSGSESLEKLFKSWLVNLQFDREDIVIKISDYKLKCDIHEIFINTSLIPFGNSFHIYKEITNNFSSHLPDPIMPVYTLEVIERVSSSGIAESSVFGCPIQIKATEVWKQDCPEKKNNLEKFNALCKTLSDSDEYLIAKLDSATSPVTYFVLMPGDDVFLVKSLANHELMLPTMKTSYLSYHDIDNEIRMEMENVLFSLPLLDEYNPEVHHSNIYDSLKRQLKANQGQHSNACLKLDQMQSTSKLFGHQNFKRPSSAQGKTSGSKKQKNIDPAKLLNHYSTLN